MDDGLQFYNTRIPHQPRTETTYKVSIHYQNGSGWNAQYIGTSKADADAEVAKWEAYNEKARADKRSWANKPVEIQVEVLEPEVTKEPVQTEEVQEVEEQSVEASEASTDEQPEVAESGKFEVEVSAVGKPFVAYRGDSLKDAKATVAAHIGKCNRVQTRVHLPEGSFWIYPGKRADGLAWDSHEQWLEDLHAGAFDSAYARDHINDLVLQGKHQEAEREAAWFRGRGINV
jgi:hypothetical protein